MITIESGKKILRDIRQELYKLSSVRYPYLASYVGTNSRGKLRTELLDLLSYLINDHNATNEGGEIEARFFTAFGMYCFYIDTDAYTQKIRQKDNGRWRSNHALNLLCAIGFFTKDWKPERYGVDLNMKLNTGRKRDMTIYHFRQLDFSTLEATAQRLRAAEITVSSISNASLRGAGLNDIADQLYFRHNPTAFDRKLSEREIILVTLDQLINDKGYCTQAELIVASGLAVDEAKRVIRAFRADILEIYRYGPPRKIDAVNYGYYYTKWIYTREGG